MVERYEKEMREGKSYLDSGRLDDALSHYRIALRNAPSRRERRAAERAIAGVSREMSYRDAFAAGEKELAKTNLEAALRHYRSAKRNKDTPEVQNRIMEVEGKLAEIEGDAAIKAGDLVTAIAAYQKAIGLKATPTLKRKLDEAMAKKERQDYLAEVKRLKANVQALKYREAAPALQALVGKYPDWPEAKKVLDAGPLKEEEVKLNKAALKVWQGLQADLKKIPPAQRTRRIEAIEAVLPQLAGSKYKALADRSIETEKNAMLSGAFTKLKKDTAKLKGQAKIDALSSALPSFKGSRYEGMIESDIENTRSQMKAADYTKLNQTTAKLKGQAKIDALEKALPEFEGTRYADLIKRSIETELNAMKSADYSKLTRQTAKLKGQPKIDALNAALPNFEGTRYKALIERAAEAELNAMKAGDYSKLMRSVARLAGQRKVATLASARPNFKGTRYEGLIDRAIQAENDKMKAAAFGRLRQDLAKRRTPQLQLVLLKEKQSEFTGTRYEKQIESMIKSTQAQIDRQEKARKDAALRKRFDSVMAEANKKKTSRDKAEYLKGVVGEFAGSNYEKTITAQIKSAEARIAAEEKAEKEKALKGQYDKVMKDLAAKKKAADKAAYLEGVIAGFKGTGYYRTLEAQLKRARSQVAAEQKAEKEAAARKVHDAVMKQLNKAPKKPEDCDANIDKLLEAKNQTAGTSWAARIDAEIKRQRVLKKRLMPKK
jgi:hypothetical protein